MASDILVDNIMMMSSQWKNNYNINFSSRTIIELNNL